MISGAPFVSLFVTSFVWTMYGVLLPDPVLVPASVFGVAAGLLCCMSFHRVSEWPVSTQPAMQLITNTCRIVQIKSTTTTHRQLQFLFRCVLAYHILYVSMCMNAFCDARQPTVLFCIIQLFTCAASPPPPVLRVWSLSLALSLRTPLRCLPPLGRYTRPSTPAHLWQSVWRSCWPTWATCSGWEALVLPSWCVRACMCSVFVSCSVKLTVSHSVTNFLEQLSSTYCVDLFSLSLSCLTLSLFLSYPLHDIIAGLLSGIFSPLTVSNCDQRQVHSLPVVLLQHHVVVQLPGLGYSRAHNTQRYEYFYPQYFRFRCGHSAAPLVCRVWPQL